MVELDFDNVDWFVFSPDFVPLFEDVLHLFFIEPFERSDRRVVDLVHGAGLASRKLELECAVFLLSASARQLGYVGDH